MYVLYYVQFVICIMFENIYICLSSLLYFINLKNDNKQELLKFYRPVIN